MGNKMEKTILPLIAIGGLAAFTGGFGLLGGGAAAGSSAAGASAAGTAAGASAGTAAGASAASAGGWFTANQHLIGLGLSGASTAATLGISSQQADLQNSALRLQEAQDSLMLAEKERDSQRKLQQILASQNNFFASVGVNASEGSAFQAMEGAKEDAEHHLSLYNHNRAVTSQMYSARRRRIANARAGTMTGALLNFGQDIQGAL